MTKWLIPIALCAIFTSCKPRQQRVSSLNVADFPGATADAQINACLASIPAGGECDARSYGATRQTIAATVNIGMYPAVTGVQRLQLSQATRFQPGSATVQPFRLGPYADIDGLHFDASNQPGYANVVALITGYLMLGNSTYVAAHLRNVIIDGGTAAPAAGSIGVELTTPDGTGSTYYVSVSDASIGGFERGVFLYAPKSSVGGVNANSFSNLRIGKCVYSMDLYGDSGFSAPALQLSGNTFVDVVAQAAPGLTKAHLYLRGAVEGNSFLGMQLFDSTADTTLTASSGTSAQQSGVYSNYIQGRLYPVRDNAAQGNTASINTWDCTNCTSNESQRNAIKAKAVGVGQK